MTTIVWFRNDLRVHDHPALATAVSEDYVLPVFILDDTQLKGKRAGSNRNRFLIESLQDLQKSLQKLGGDLVIRHGDAVTELTRLAKEMNVANVYATADYTPFSVQRDKKIKASIEKNDVSLRLFPGRLIVGKLDALHTQKGNPHKVFTPFWRQWSTVQRREIAQTPEKIPMPKGIRSDKLPKLEDITNKTDLSPDALPGGEKAALKRFDDFLENGVARYADDNNDLDLEGTSRLSPYLHFGCISPLYIESQLPDNAGAAAWNRQLAWRDFYNYILYHFPKNLRQEFQERFRSLEWVDDAKSLKAWQEGKSGYPIIDAAMRQLNTEGWMHNRGRLIVGSFLTKDLNLDWREGEAYFLRMLMDGDQANNNGNWQWITSVGVDPAPVFRRLYNPVTQQERHDPNGVYVRKYVPELRKVPDEYIAEPWKMPDEIQQSAGCVIGKDYPGPIIDHAEARKVALDRYRQTAV